MNCIRLKSLTLLARQYDIGINIDAEEADREISLDLLEAALNRAGGWNGLASFRPTKTLPVRH
jgi:RHH-type proline utilization regulon transcriptional repressor/proline dehydrogenase/delta 1-pyrroline-5-carboxylate dehydrogenase